MSIFELKEIDQTTLSKLVQETCESFQNLKNLYDKDFLEDLITKRFRYDNYLLWLLVSREKYALATWKDISKFMDILKDVDITTHFKNKLRSTTEPVLESYLTELEFAAYYGEKGYIVELEPKISDSGKNPEFKITSGNFKVYFEVKNIFWEKMATMNNIEAQIHGEIGKTKEKFVFVISYTPKFKIGDISSLKKLVIAKLKTIPNGHELPIRFTFTDETDLLAEIKVVGKPNRLPYGYLGGLMRTEAFSIPGGKEIRRKISKKIPQLPRDEASVIVIEPGQIFIHEEDVLNALYGDEKAVINLKDNSAHLERSYNGTFSPRINTRLSAVIFFKKKWNEESQNFKRLRVVYHNPFAKKKIDTEFFDDVDVKQFIPVKERNLIRMVWK